MHSIINHSLIYSETNASSCEFSEYTRHTGFLWADISLRFSLSLSFLSSVSQTIFLTERHVNARGEECFMYVIMRQVRMAVTYGCNDKLLMQVSHLHTSYIYLYAFSRGNSTAEIPDAFRVTGRMRNCARSSHKPKSK